MENKVGRNDPCPCGSGKKYKNCCMGKKEESKKTYTAAGKRKFKAKVLSSTDMRSQSLFSGSASQAPAEAPSFDVLKVRLAKTDYRVKEEDAEKTPLPFVIPGPESAQQPSDRKSVV